jgi:hypothetical protein
MHKRNLDHLTIWHNIGCDVENGFWAIAGARQGTYMTMLSDWDYREVQWFDTLKTIWESTVAEQDPAGVIDFYTDPLATRLGLPMAFMPPFQSAFFKDHYRSNWHNLGVMTREIDVIRRQEGW